MVVKRDKTKINSYLKLVSRKSNKSSKWIRISAKPIQTRIGFRVLVYIYTLLTPLAAELICFCRFCGCKNTRHNPKKPIPIRRASTHLFKEADWCVCEHRGS